VEAGAGVFSQYAVEKGSMDSGRGSATVSIERNQSSAHPYPVAFPS
jgi:hypothetical protein